MGKIISFFNHKGGVGKTTLVHNVAFDLARKGDKKVLMIDMDAQMNLTSATFGFSDAIRYDTINVNDTSTDWKTLLSKHVSAHDYFMSALIGEKLAEEKKIFDVKTSHPKYNDMITAQLSKGDVHLLCGSIDIPQLDVVLFSAISNKNELNNRIPRRFESALREIASQYDYVLIDTSPSAVSMVNALSVLCADYFVLPVFPTFFSLQAIDNLPDIFKFWIETLSPYRGTTNKNGLSLGSKFLGLFVQMAKRYSQKDGKKETLHARDWSKKINQSVDGLRLFLSDSERTITKEAFKKIFKDATPFLIGECNDFTSKLRHIAESAGLPLILLNNQVCKDIEEKNSKSLIQVNNPRSTYKAPFDHACASYGKMTEGLLCL